MLLPGSDLVGMQYDPIFTQTGEKFPIIHASHVTSQAGTGIVHCAPAHGAEDYNAFRSLSLDSMLCHVDNLGQFSEDVCSVVGQRDGRELVGKPVLGDGTHAIVRLLKDRDAVVKVKYYKHKYPYDWRTNQPIIVT